MITQCLFSRLTCLSCLTVITFIFCITQEFTYILNLHSYISTTNIIENHPPLIQILAENVLKYPDGNNKKLKNFQGSDIDLDDWKPVTDKIYAYSAYWDDRYSNESFIKIIAGGKISNGSLRLKCLLSNDSISGAYIERSSKYKVLIEHHNKPSKAIYIICSPSGYDRPNFVSLVPSNWNDTDFRKIIWMEVHSLQVNRKRSLIGVCVRPLFNYTEVFHIAEFVAYYEALGVSHFTFYNHDSSEDVEILFEQLQENDYVIDFLPWTLPKDLEDMWALGQIASINDCIYRHMGTTSYIAVVDLDEFITPRHVINLKQLLSLHDLKLKHFSSFVFRSCVFCLEYEQDTLPTYIPNFITQTRIRRENTIYPFIIRTKYIVKPEHVIVAGVHHVWELVPGFDEHFIPASHALVHHYRANLCVGKNKTLEKGEVDVMSRKYLNPLLRSNLSPFGKIVWYSKFSEN